MKHVRNGEVVGGVVNEASKVTLSEGGGTVEESLVVQDISDQINVLVTTGGEQPAYVYKFGKVVNVLLDLYFTSTGVNLTVATGFPKPKGLYGQGTIANNASNDNTYIHRAAILSNGELKVEKVDAVGYARIAITYICE